jgi:hypothetical protein
MRLFKRSLASARKLGAVGWELRTAISIARLISAGENASGRAEARDLLISTRDNLRPRKLPATCARLMIWQEH